MREILFRGKRYDNGNWVEGYLIHDEVCNTHIPYIGYLFGDDIDVAEIILGTVGQYTGLTDKNGTKIFEGDVVKVLQGKDKGVTYVGFENGSFMLYPRTGNIYERTLWAYWYNDWDVEIIGNIHDNPELIGRNDNA